jgi:hypothetical protein
MRIAGEHLDEPLTKCSCSLLFSMRVYASPLSSSINILAVLDGSVRAMRHTSWNRSNESEEERQQQGQDEDRKIVAMPVSEIESGTKIQARRKGEKSQDLLIKRSDVHALDWPSPPEAPRVGAFSSAGYFRLGGAWLALCPFACIRMCAEVCMFMRSLFLHAIGASARAVCARFFDGKDMGSSGRTAAVVTQAS